MEVVQRRVSGLDGVGRDLALDGEGRELLEEFPEILNLLREGVGGFANLASLELLHHAQLLLDVEALLLERTPRQRRLLELLEDVLADADAVRLEQRHGGHQRLEHPIRLILPLSQIAHVTHHLVQQLVAAGVVQLLVGVGRVLGQHHVAARHELVELGHGVDHLVAEVVREQKHPLGDPRGERLLHRLGVDSDPANHRAGGQVRDLLLHRLVLGDLGVEDVQLGIVAVRAVGLDELRQGGVEVVAPQVLVLVVALLERHALRLVREDHRLELGHAVEDVEVFFQLLHVVALADVQAADQRPGVLKSSDPPVDQIANARPFRIAALANLRRPLDVRHRELQGNFQQRGLLRLREDLRVDLLVEVFQRRENSVGVSLHDDFVDVLDVFAPSLGRPRHVHLLVGHLEELGDLHAAVGDLLVALRLQLLLHLLELVYGVRLAVFTVNHEVLLPLPKDVLGLLHAVLEVVQDGVELLHRGHHLREVVVDLVRVPVERRDRLLEHLLDVFNLGRHEGALDGEQGAEDVVEGADDEVEVTRLLTQRFVPLVNLASGRGHAGVEQHEILRLPEQLHELGVKVHAQNSGDLSLLVVREQVELELLLARRVHLLGPVLEHLGLVLFELRRDSLVEFRHLAGLVSLHHQLVQGRELLHGVLHALVQRAHPLHRARARGEVLAHHRLIPLRVEYGLHLPEVGAEEAHQLHLLLLQIRHDDLALQQTFERVEELKRGADGDAILEALDDDGTEPPFELLDHGPELVKVVVKLLRLHVHHVVLNLVKLLQRLDKIGVDLPNVRGQRLALRASNLHALELVELQHRLRQVEDVVAPLEKRVQPGE
mmetsp:Transcript_9872/g.40457  ORF Transcript_9872/g.40457 Transcript_9872/m.40457 type:complete len:831 (+) Transcript_9872:10660-13152(+)